MADCQLKTVSTYFKVKSERFLRLSIRACESNAFIEVYEDITEKDEKVFSFGCYGSIYGYGNSEETDINDFNDFYKDLQDNLPEGETIIIYEIGHQKLEYLSGECTVIGKNKFAKFDMCQEAEKISEEFKQEKP